MLVLTLVLTHTTSHLFLVFSSSFHKRYTFNSIELKMSSMSDRKAELERKKAKLQALREEKDRRRREKEQKDAEEALVIMIFRFYEMLVK